VAPGKFYSFGKLLLTGEYLVLHGAKALAVPLKKGQGMVVSPGNRSSVIEWRAYSLGHEWFSADLSLPGFRMLHSSDPEKASFLSVILQAANDLSPGLTNGNDSFVVHTELDFDIRWGLGSSSTLVSNIAFWFQTDPFKLFKKVFPGSGYDIFCARSGKPIIFQLDGGDPLVREVEFKPEFMNDLYFIYLGNKQDSQASVSKFRQEYSIDRSHLNRISGLTEAMLFQHDLQGFMELLEEHESLMSEILGVPPVGSSMFRDFPGVVKSLGAWGGDFVLAASPIPEAEVFKYFSSRKLEVIFRYPDLALDF
jgi:mevalonate kinase